jgi:hypothetical protein
MIAAANNTLVVTLDIDRAPDFMIAETAVDGSVTVLCGASVLVLQEIEVEGAGRGPAARFVRSHRARFGIDAAAEIESLRRRVAVLEARASLAGKSA